MKNPVELSKLHLLDPNAPCLDIDRLPLVYILMDAEHRVTAWNSAAERTFGFTRSEVIGRVCTDIILPRPMSVDIQQVLARLHAGDMDAHSINDNCTRDGRSITCEWFNTPLRGPNGKFAGIVSLAQDITSRRQTEQALEYYTAQLQHLSQRLVEVQERERQHIASELHDQIGQMLTGLMLLSQFNPRASREDTQNRIEPVPLRDAAADKRFMSPLLERKATNNDIAQSCSRPERLHDLLTRREWEVFRLSASGLTRTAVAARLHISPRTVECHRANLMRKLQVNNLSELIRYAVKHRLLPVDE